MIANTLFDLIDIFLVALCRRSVEEVRRLQDIAAAVRPPLVTPAEEVRKGGKLTTPITLI